jgi:hypothetical protein
MRELTWSRIGENAMGISYDLGIHSPSNSRQEDYSIHYMINNKVVRNLLATIIRWRLTIIKVRVPGGALMSKKKLRHNDVDDQIKASLRYFWYLRHHTFSTLGRRHAL